MKELQQTVLALSSGQWWISPSWALANAYEMAKVLSLEESEDKQKTKQVATAAYSASAGVSSLSDAPAGSVAVMAIRGPIVKYSNWYGIGSKDYVSTLNSIYGDKRFLGAILIVDSPGGMVSGTRELFQTVANPVKPIISLVDNLAASAAYYGIVGSDAIYATQPNDIIGSIGTYSVLADYKAYFEKQGLPIYEVYAAQSTEKNLEVRELFANKDEKLLKAELTEYNQFFIDDVKASRGSKLNPKAGDPFKGATYLSEEAQKLGLIDGISNISSAMEEITDRSLTKKRKSTTMSLIKDLKSLLGKHGEEETSEDTTAQLTKERDDAQAQVTALTKERDEAKAQVTALTKERDEAKAQVTTLTKERDEAKAEVTRLGQQPGDKPTPKATEEQVEKTGSAKTPQQIMDSLPHNQEADKLFG